MRYDVFGAMPMEELWTLHQTIVSILAEKLEGEKARHANFKWVIVELQCVLAATSYFFDGR